MLLNGGTHTNNLISPKVVIRFFHSGGCTPAPFLYAGSFPPPPFFFPLSHRGVAPGGCTPAPPPPPPGSAPEPDCIHALHTHRSVLELYWDAERILSQALWGSPDRGGIYNNKNKFCSYPVLDTILYSRRHYPSGVIHYYMTPQTQGTCRLHSHSICNAWKYQIWFQSKYKYLRDLARTST